MIFTWTNIATATTVARGLRRLGYRADMVGVHIQTNASPQQLRKITNLAWSVDVPGSARFFEEAQ